MDKFVCVGTHGAGKSTFTYLLASELKKHNKNVYILQEKVRQSPFPINEKMCPETSIWASCSQIAEELNAQIRGFNTLIADRSPYDTFLYAHHFDLTHPVFSQFKKSAFEWLQSYKKIWWIRPDVPLQTDGIRSPNLGFQKKIDSLFDHFFTTFNEIPKETIWTSHIYEYQQNSNLVGSLLASLL